MAKALGTDDSVNTCDCCGRTDLKFTVTMEMDDGEIVHYGQVCAGRNTGKTQALINREIKDEAKRVRDAAAAEYFACVEYRALSAKLAQRPRSLIGRAAADFIRIESDAEMAKRREIAEKFGIKPYEVAV